MLDSRQLAETVKRLRKTGIGALDDLPWGTHFCNFYETREDLLDILIPYFVAGMDNNEFCLWVASDPVGEADAADVLTRAAPRTRRHLDAGDIEIVPYSRCFFREGAVDLDWAVQGWNAKLAEALAKGYDGMRVSGNTSWLMDEYRKAVANYEQFVNEGIAGRELMVLCAYPLAATAATELFDVAKFHQFVMARRNGNWEVLESCEFKNAKQELQALSREFDRRVTERTAELAAANDRLKTFSGQLRALAASAQSAREAEGARIARELHDEFGSALLSLKWEVEALQEQIPGWQDQSTLTGARETLGSMTKLIDTAITAVRRVASELRPKVLDDLGLVAAIEWQVQQFGARTQITCFFEAPSDAVRLNHEQQTAVFRILQEALTNIRRHAHATTVAIAMNEQGDTFVLTIRDNGTGITEAEKSRPSSIGLLGMQERAQLVGGGVEIEGFERKGTLVTIKIPILLATIAGATQD